MKASVTRPTDEIDIVQTAAVKLPAKTTRIPAATRVAVHQERERERESDLFKRETEHL